jgi:ribose-phosphate pyrophosphokinase
LVLRAIKQFDIKIDALVSPDFGASKKIYKLATELDLPVIQANKVRDNKGQIIKTEVYVDNLEGKDVLIVDDCCDGARTFIEIAKVLKEKNVGSISLYVTHGIFSKGLDVIFESGISKIYTTSSFRNGLEYENLFVMDLNS